MPMFMKVCVFPQKGFDVFNALDLMENTVFLEKLKFGIGDGNLQYYLYNWKCPPMEPDKVRINDIHLQTTITAFPLTTAHWLHFQVGIVLQ